MADRINIDELFQQYSRQINAVVEATEKNYKKSGEILSWFYGGTVEGWRKYLKKKKGSAMPEAVKEFLKLNK